MADTKRTRAQILTLLADNITQEIKAQQFRDWFVSDWPEDRVYPDDFWTRPKAPFLITDKTAKGDFFYSQIIGQQVSFGNVMFMATDGTWRRALAGDSAKLGLLAVVLNSYASGATNGLLVRDALIYNADMSGLYAIGKPIYLASDLSGGITSIRTSANPILLGFMMPTNPGDIASGKFYFNPPWDVRG